jgi:hypothetical protein
VAETTIGVLHGPEVLERLHHLGHRRVLLPDGDVDADDAFALLVDDRVQGERGLARLAVADDELALAAADVDHRVHGLDARLQRLAHGLAGDDAGGDPLDLAEDLGRDGALAVDGLAQRVDHAPDHVLAHGHGHDAAGALDLVPFLDLREVAHEHGPDGVLFEVEGDAHHAVGQVEQLARHAALEAVDARDAVAQGEDGSHLGDVDAGAEAAELLADDLGDLFGPNVHWLSSLPLRPCELFAQGAQARPHAAVVDAPFHPEEQAAHEAWVDAAAQLDLFAPVARRPRRRSRALPSRPARAR